MGGNVTTQSTHSHRGSDLNPSRIETDPRLARCTADRASHATRLVVVRSMMPLLYSLVGVLVFVVLWTTVIWVWRPPEFILPAPAAVLDAAWANAGSLLENAWITGYEVLLGFLLAALAGIGAALLIHLWSRLGTVLWPVVLLAQITPQIAFAPLLILWLGIGLASKIVIAALIAFFPILVNTYIGLQSIDEATEDLAKSMLAGRTRYLIQFELPNALPHILVGLKIAITYAVVGAVVAEFISSNNGLGNSLLVANGNLDSSYAMAALIMLSAMGLALFGVISLAERLAVPWHISQRRRAGALVS